MAQKLPLDECLKKLNETIPVTPDGVAEYKAAVIELQARMVMNSGFPEAVLDRVWALMGKNPPGADGSTSNDQENKP